MAEYWGAKPKGNTVPETQQEGAGGGGGGGGNPLTRKIGPMPMWAWLAIFTAVIVVYAYIKKAKSGTTTGAGTSTGATSVNSPGGVDSSLVPQFVNQTYTQTTPPASPNVTITDSGNTTTTGTATKTAQTVSGAPGSYSLDVGGSGNNEWTSTGKYSLNTIAKSHGMTAAQLIAVSESSENNPALKAYVAKKNYNAMLPAGVQLFIPAAKWKTT